MDKKFLCVINTKKDFITKHLNTRKVNYIIYLDTKSFLLCAKNFSQSLVCVGNINLVIKNNNKLLMYFI